MRPVQLIDRGECPNDRRFQNNCNWQKVKAALAILTGCGSFTGQGVFQK